MPVVWLAAAVFVYAGGATASLAQSPAPPQTPAQTQLQLGNKARAKGDAETSVTHFVQAYALARAANDTTTQANALGLLAVQWIGLNRYEEAIEACNAALPLARQLHDRPLEGRLLQNLGSALWTRGDPDGALTAAEAALTIRRDLNDTFGIALTQHLLASIAYATGDLQSAVLRYQEAARLWREINIPAGLANTLDGLGITYLASGDPDRARQQHEAALPLWTSVKSPLGQGPSLNNLGMVAHRQKDFPQAQAAFEKALALTSNDTRSQAYILHNLGHLAADRNRPQEAIDTLTKSLAYATEIGDTFSAGRSLYRIGLAQQQLKLPDAQTSLNRALTQQLHSGDRDGASLTRTALAIQARTQGDLAAAESLAAEAIQTVEATRTGFASPDLRVTYLAAHARQYDVWIGTLLAQGKTEAALHASERARARALLDGLAGWSPKLQTDRANLVSRLTAAERELRGRAATLAQPNLTPTRRDQAARRLSESEARYQEIRSLLRASADAPAFDPPEPLAPAAARKLLDPDTAALAFWISDTQSVAWVITDRSVKLVRLPPAAQIQTLATALQSAYSARSQLIPGESLDARQKRRSAPTPSAHDLSRLVLQPLLAGLRQTRLLVIPATPLHGLPWAAIPLNGKPLLATHQVILLPSLSALDSIRRQHPTRIPAWRAAAVIDPVYRDPFPPLPHTRREAAAIPQAALLAGADATPNALNLPAVRQANLLHFGVHTEVNASQPQLSSLVLSLQDRNGNPTDGYLRQYDIHDLRLHAELIVLSACRSAEGREAQGEGVLGLTRAFLYGGAARVVASLWSVDDQATAELMTRFYQGLYRDHLTPARALRQAQLALAAIPRWSNPEYWAPFQLYGDYR